MRTELIGVVLCGGQSMRMGRDKGLIVTDGIAAAERAAALLRRFSARVVLSLRAEQAQAYAAVLPALAQVYDIFSDLGPLGGLLSVHRKFPGADIFLLACDMPAVTHADIGYLLAQKSALVAYRSGVVFEPLCAFYAADACAQIMRQTEAAWQRGAQPSGLQRLLHEFNATAIHPTLPANLVSQNTALLL